MLCSLSSKLEAQDLEAIKGLEKELGVNLVSFTCHDLDVAKISDEQLAKIQSLENRLGVSLVAVGR